MTETVAIAPPLTVMTVNIHKGFTTFNRKFILPELRDAVRKVGADLVFLQEVMGEIDRKGRNGHHHPGRPRSSPDQPTRAIGGPGPDASSTG